MSGNIDPRTMSAETPDHGSAPSFEGLFGAAEKALELRRGEYVFRRGEPADAVFVVASGRLRLERSLEDGTPVTLAVLGPGDGVAEAALFADAYHCDARAEIACRLWLYPKAGVLEHLRRDPAGMGRLTRHLAAQVRRLRAMLELRSVKRADDRVLAYLDLLEALEEAWADRPARAVAAQLGLTPEALYRALGRLERAALIVRDGRQVRKAGNDRKS